MEIVAERGPDSFAEKALHFRFGRIRGDDFPRFVDEHHFVEEHFLGDLDADEVVRGGKHLARQIHRLHPVIVGADAIFRRDDVGKGHLAERRGGKRGTGRPPAAGKSEREIFARLGIHAADVDINFLQLIAARGGVVEIKDDLGVLAGQIGVPVRGKPADKHGEHEGDRRPAEARDAR